MQHLLKTIDRRRAYIRDTIEAGRVQMVNYFAARYSWGQPCDPARANDWGVMCAHLRQCLEQGKKPDYFAQWIWPSGNRGSIMRMIDVYHDGWDLLADIGAIEREEFDEVEA